MTKPSTNSKLFLRTCCTEIKRQTLKRCWMMESFSAWPWLPHRDVQLEQSGGAGNEFTWVHGWISRVRRLRNRHVCVSVFLYLYETQGCESLWFVAFVGGCGNSSLSHSSMYCNLLCARKANRFLDPTYTSPPAVTNNFCVSGRSEHEQTVSTR